MERQRVQAAAGWDTAPEDKGCIWVGLNHKHNLDSSHPGVREELCSENPTAPLLYSLFTKKSRTIEQENHPRDGREGPSSGRPQLLFSEPGGLGSLGLELHLGTQFPGRGREETLNKKKWPQQEAVYDQGVSPRVIPPPPGDTGPRLGTSDICACCDWGAAGIKGLWPGRLLHTPKCPGLAQRITPHVPSFCYSS